MENPTTWGKAEHTVMKAMAEHERSRRSGVVGLSLIRTITDALRREGLLAEDGQEQNHPTDLQDRP